LLKRYTLSGMNVVILGAGRVGFRLAKQLIEEDKNIVLIEKDPEKARQAADLLDCLVLNEAGNNLITLRKAGTGKADYFIGVTDSDEVNMIACGMVSSEFPVPNKIARIRNIDYSSITMIQRSFPGIDYFVNPEIEASKAIIRAVEHGAVSDVVFFEKSDLQMRSITVGGGSVFNNTSIEEIKKIVQTNFLVAVILRDDFSIIPRGDSVVRENDRLYLIATEESFEKIFSQVGKSIMKPNKIVLIGGSRIGRYVAEHFIHPPKRVFSMFARLLRRFGRVTKRKINIIDSDHENCRMLADRFPEALVINADISDEGFSEEEQLSDADLVIAVTDNQELNIINAVYAKSLGAKRSIALVNKSKYVNIASNLGIDVAISSVDSMVDSILKYIRNSNIRSVYSISGGKVEVIELSVVLSSRIVGKKIKEIRLPKDSLILSVSRESKDIIPDGDLSLQSGDHLIVITRKESVPKIEQLVTG